MFVLLDALVVLPLVAVVNCYNFCFMTDVAYVYICIYICDLHCNIYIYIYISDMHFCVYLKSNERLLVSLSVSLSLSLSLSLYTRTHMRVYYNTYIDVCLKQ